MKISIMLALCLVGLTVVALENPMASADRTAAVPELTNLNSDIFVRQAAQDGMLEVELGKVALVKASSDAIKAFAKTMITDHGAAIKQLEEVAANTGYKAPASLDEEHRSKLADMQKLSGPEFDKAYIEEMGDAHKQALVLFKQASTAATVNAKLQMFARKTLPTLEQHQQMAMRLTSSEPISPRTLPPGP